MRPGNRPDNGRDAELEDDVMVIIRDKNVCGWAFGRLHIRFCLSVDSIFEFHLFVSGRCIPLFFVRDLEELAV
jgi:hypothetical protein